MLRSLDPRRSLAAGLIWLVVGLAASFAVAASIWAGRIAREIVVQQHVRRLVLETDQLASDLSQAVSMRLAAIRAADGNAAPDDVFRRLIAAYPELGWLSIADASGVLLAAGADMHPGSSVGASPWFQQGLKGPWIGVIQESRHSSAGPLLGDLSAPLRDSSGRIVGVIAAHLSWRWAVADVQRLSTALDRRGSAQTLVIDLAGIVAVGPDELRNRPWNGVLLDEAPPIEPSTWQSAAPRFERLPNGDTVLVTRAPLRLDAAQAADAWTVQLSEPKKLVYQRADALAIRILWISICLGAAMAVLGTLGAGHLTHRLKNLARSAAAVGRNEVARIEVPHGRDEVAQLAAAFAKILDDLRQERSELLKLSSDLERRVAVRTREVERLAKESQYAAIARERLQIARDLHDTLAHSMMAMLSEVRLLRKLQGHDPASVGEELARAEEVAHAGLNEARSAIAQMRVSSVRDLGLGPAIAKAIVRFKDRTGLTVELSMDPDAARFGDERAEVIFRMTEEALRNIEHHARASRVRIALSSADAAHLQLEIADDGVGFDTSLSRPGHFGLVGLREQAQLIGAELQIQSTPNSGTTLRLSLRIAPEAL
ncbi:MAG TPA: histidine kinase [Steroidobacteraceae bacterium]|nr:histidine kinase [Steroidobacteraceae bacterium]